MRIGAVLFCLLLADALCHAFLALMTLFWAGNLFAWLNRLSEEFGMVWLGDERFSYLYQSQSFALAAVMVWIAAKLLPNLRRSGLEPDCRSWMQLWLLLKIILLLAFLRVPFFEYAQPVFWLFAGWEITGILPITWWFFKERK